MCLPAFHSATLFKTWRFNINRRTYFVLAALQRSATTWHRYPLISMKGHSNLILRLSPVSQQLHFYNSPGCFTTIPGCCCCWRHRACHRTRCWARSCLHAQLCCTLAAEPPLALEPHLVRKPSAAHSHKHVSSAPKYWCRFKCSHKLISRASTSALQIDCIVPIQWFLDRRIILDPHFEGNSKHHCDQLHSRDYVLL